MRILIANRGEIARRVIRTARALGYDTVAVYADPDAQAPFVTEADASVRIGPADLASSYLSIEAILDAAHQSEADAVHPGYGFLSENAEFAQAVVGSGLVWIGPHPEAIARMGSKIEARRIAADAGVPVIPGYDASQDPADLREAADAIGYPVLVKASAGGGGKGIRVAADSAGFSSALDAARSEAKRAFGDDRVIVERYVGRPRHIEVQVVGDRHGRVIDLGTRECSVQRRYQKLLEEAPACHIAPTSEEGMRAAAVALAEAISYDSAGTVEYIVDDDSGDFFFLEMNTRLQVEHPVTEAVTGLDLVELQIRSAFGEHLPELSVEPAGHAFEARINAEDAFAGFVPQVGTVTDVLVPEGVRWESAIERGSVVTPHYDPMIAKLIVTGPDRDTARRRLAAALEGLVVGGVVTNAGFHRWLIDQSPVVDGRVTTRFLDEVALPPPPDEAIAARLAASVWLRHRPVPPTASPWRHLPGMRLTPHQRVSTVFLRGREVHEITLDADELPVTQAHVVDRRRVAINVSGHTHTFEVRTRSEHWAPATAVGHGPAGAVTAPFPGVMAEVGVAPGESVAAGQVVAVIEAMKMLHPLTTVGAAVVDEVRVSQGDQVAGGQVLITFHTHPASGDDE